MFMYTDLLLLHYQFSCATGLLYTPCLRKISCNENLVWGLFSAFYDIYGIVLCMCFTATHRAMTNT